MGTNTCRYGYGTLCRLTFPSDAFSQPPPGHGSQDHHRATPDEHSPQSHRAGPTHNHPVSIQHAVQTLTEFRELHQLRREIQVDLDSDAGDQNSHKDYIAEVSIAYITLALCCEPF